MLTYFTPGEAKALTLAPEQSILGQAIDLAQSKGGAAARDPEAAFLLVLQWLRDTVMAKGLTVEAALLTLLQDMAAGQPLTATLVKALNASGLAEPLLRRLEKLQRQGHFLFQLDKDHVPRLRRLSELADADPLQLDFAETRSTNLSGDKLVFNVSAGVDLAIGLEVLSAAKAKKKYLTEVEGHGLALFARGALAGSIDVGESILKASAGASAERSLSLLYQFNPDETSVGALHHVIHDVPSSLALKALHEKLDPPGEDGLRQFSIGSATGFAFSLSGSKGISSVKLRTVNVRGKSQEIRTELTAGASLKVSYQDKGSRVIRVLKLPSGDLQLIAREERARNHNVGFGLSAGLKVTGWETLAGKLLREALPEVDGLLQKLEPLAQPGAWLSNVLKARLPANAADIALLLTGEIDPAAATDALVERVQALLQTRFDLWAAAVEGKAEGLANSLTLALVEGISQQVLADEVRTWLQTALADVITAARSELDQWIRSEVVDPAGALVKAPIRAITDALAKAGQPLQKAVNAAADLFGPLIEFLKRYGALRAKVIAAAEKSLKLQISAKLDYSFKRVSKDSLDFSLVLPSVVAGSGALAVERDFRCLLRGKPFVDPSAPFGIPAAQIEGEWLAVSERLTEIGLGVSLDLGFPSASVSAGILLQANTRVEVGPSGVLLAKTVASAKQSYRWGGEAFSALGRGVFDALVARDAEGDARQALTQFSLDVELADERFTEGELDSLLASLREGGRSLLDAAEEAAVRQQWQRLHDDAGGPPAARLRLGMALDDAARSQVVALASQRSALRRVAIEAMVQACADREGRDLAAGLRLFDYTGNPVDVLHAEWKALVRTLSGPGAAALNSINGVAIPMVGPSDPYVRAATGLRKSARALRFFVEAIEQVAIWPHPDTVRSTIQSQIATGMHGGKTLARVLADHYDRLGTAFAADLARSMSASDSAYDNSENVPANTLFVILALRAMTDAELLADVVALE